MSAWCLLRAAARPCAVLLMGLGVLAGCARAPLRGPDAALLAAQAGREAMLSTQSHWRLSGRIAVSGEGEGGSGRIDWDQRGDSYTIELSAPVTRRSWRLSGDARGARLEGLEQGVLEDQDAEALLRRAAGWSMPLDPLRAWVRGARAGAHAEIQFGAQGLPAVLHQRGWSIEYRSWSEVDGLALPVRVFAGAGQRRVRLVVDRWEIGGD